MSMPYFDEFELNTNEAENADGSITFPIEGTDALFNFVTGDIVLADGDPEEVTDVDALKQWIHKALITRRGIWEIYRTGAELEAVDDDTEDPGVDPDAGGVPVENADSVELFGSNIYDIFFSDTERMYKQAEIQRDIEETLSVHPDIEDVKDFEFVQHKRELIVYFTVDSVYGTERQGVTL